MTDSEQSTAETRAAAAAEIKRFLHGLRHVVQLASDLEELAGIEKTIAETRKHLDALKEHDGKWREVAELEAKLPELRALEGRIPTLHRLEDLAEAERVAGTSLLAAQNAESAIRKRLAELQVKVDDAGATLAELDKAIASKRAELGEIESAFKRWRDRIA